MATDSEILAEVEGAFGRCERPEHFTNWTHCSECEEHDQLLQSRTVSTLALGDIENPGWDPLCFISAEGFKYFFPALARIALETVGWDWYGGQLLFHLTYDGAKNRHLLACDAQQRRAVASLLLHFAEGHAEVVEQCLETEALATAISLWNG